MSVEYEEENLSRASIIQDADNWKPFRIEKCVHCGKTPSINRNDSAKGNESYTIRCCDQIAKGRSETEVMVNWNRINTIDGSIFADIGSGFVEGFGDGIIT